MLLRFGLIYSFNLRTTKSITDFQTGLNEFVDFEKKIFFGFFRDKIYVGKKSKKGFFISKKVGKSKHEIDGTFVSLEKYTLVKVTTTTEPLTLHFLCFAFCVSALFIIICTPFMILKDVRSQQLGVLIFIFTPALVFLSISSTQLKITTEDIKLKLKKIAT